MAGLGLGFARASQPPHETNKPAATAGKGKDARNRGWADDTSRFGYQMLLKMGWKDGKGLGVSEDGCVDAVRALRRPDNRGIGATDSSKAWIKHTVELERILENLNRKHGDNSSASEGDDDAEVVKTREMGRDFKRAKRDLCVDDGESDDCQGMVGVEGGGGEGDGGKEETVKVKKRKRKESESEKGGGGGEDEETMDEKKRKKEEKKKRKKEKEKENKKKRKKEKRKEKGKGVGGKAKHPFQVMFHASRRTRSAKNAKAYSAAAFKEIMGQHDEDDCL